MCVHKAHFVKQDMTEVTREFCQETECELIHERTNWISSNNQFHENSEKTHREFHHNSFLFLSNLVLVVHQETKEPARCDVIRVSFDSVIDASFMKTRTGTESELVVLLLQQ